MYKLLTFLLLLVTLSGVSQIEVNYKVNAFADLTNFTLHGNVEIEIVNTGTSPILEIPIEIWPNAYQPNGTFLAQERLEDQKTDLFFAQPAELGKVDSLNFHATIFYDKTRSSTVNFKKIDGGELYLLTLDQPLLQGNRAEIATTFKIKLPASKFNGFGFDLNSVRLSRWFPRVSGYSDSVFYPVFNNRDRYVHLNKGKIEVKLITDASTRVLASAKAKVTQQNETLNLHEFNLTNVGDLVLTMFPEIYEFKIPKEATDGRNITLYYGSEFPYLDFNLGLNKVFTFMKNELNVTPPENIDLLFLKNKLAFESSGSFIVLEEQANSEDIEAAIVEEWVKLLFSEKVQINGAQHPWMVHGLAHYYKTVYLRKNYPDKLFVGKLGKTAIGKFFDADEYPNDFRNIFFYHYMARQALDQPVSDSAAAYPRFNYQAVVKGKTTLNLDYLRLYSGEKEFKRSIQKFLKDNSESGKFAQPQDFIESFSYYVFRDLDWFLNDIYTSSKKYNYRLKKTENCTYIYTATVKNKGQIASPFSLTGIKNGKPVLTEWYEGHKGKKTVQVHLEDYDEVVLNYTNRFPEYNQKDNALKTKGLFKRSKPLKLQFYTSFENPNKNQLFWMPSAKYNAYDQFLVGASFYNSTFVQKPFEYKITPEFSTGTATLVGSGSVKYNWILPEKKFRQISAGIYGRYYHYNKDLSYTRLSPSLNFYLRKKSPRSNVLRKFHLRAVLMDKELPSDFDGNKFDLDFASYQVVNLQYIHEDVNVLRPNKLIVSAEYSDLFSKLQIDFVQRWRVTKNHTFAFRFFAGTFLHNQNADNDNFYSFGLSGTRDYMFDFYFIGRSDKEGVWANQMYETDGGFKSQTNLFSNTGLVSLNVKVPIWRYFKIFGDAAVINLINQSNNAFVWDYGLSVVIVPDFLEIHFPIQSSEQNFLENGNYAQNIRYVLNLDPTEIINRLRRGYY